MNQKEREERDANPPPELVEECRKINEDFLREHKAHTKPYFVDDEFDGEWKIMLVWEHGCVQHICPGSIDSHGCYLMVRALKETREHAIQLGRAAAAYDQFCAAARQAGVKPQEVFDIFNNQGRI